jgi:phytoene synthase
MDPFEHCRDLTAQHQKERYWASLYAPSEKRGALYALYAFDHEIARVSSVVREPLAGEIRLQWWRDVLTGLRREDAAAHPVAAALLHTIDAYGLSSARLVAFIDAHSADLYEEPIDPERYGAETFGTIVAVAAQILGGQSEDLEHIARHVGAAEVVASTRPDEAQQHREAAARLLPKLPESVLPALLPAATIGKRDLPLWRRQWLIWRAARNAQRIFA